ncbi:GNAT family N-acetyltransferase [Escherichia coli]|uniref:GNAT family N-acetyltransferase n=2 Tax=Enterobacteriaceae TaxID=543 RepID=UPI00280B8B3A|nr:GNAT family N-acetyltransferase [Escherichia coli]
MDSEEPPNVRVACSGDIDEVVRLMHDAAAWMSAKGTPAWDVARIDRTFAETFVLRSELLVASCSDGIVGCCTLSAEDPEFWPDALKGEAAYLHKLAVRRTHAGRGVSSALIEACRHAARTQGCAKLRLDCHPNRHCCKVSDEAAFCLIQRPYISKTLLTRRISPRGSP